MKALPKRKGNELPRNIGGTLAKASMKALPKRKGNAVLVSHISKMRAPQ